MIEKTSNLQLSVSGMNVRIFGSENAGAPLVILNTLDDAGAVYREIAQPVTLAGVSGFDWNRDLSPWPAPAAYPNGEAFTGEAETFLQNLTGELLPRVSAELSEPPAYTAVAGYSLAGLFAIWSLYRTDIFSRAASASDSLWYQDFSTFTCEHEMPEKPVCISLSLGDKESRTRNPVLRTVQERTDELAGLFRSRGIRTVFSMEKGNHFQEPDRRMARAIRAMLEG